MVTLQQTTGLSDAEMEILGAIREAIRKAVPSADIVLFGSQARGEGREDSDWDVLVLMGTPNSQLKHRVREALYGVELEKDILINSLFLEKRAWYKGRYRTHPLHGRVEAEGIRL